MTDYPTSDHSETNRTSPGDGPSGRTGNTDQEDPVDVHRQATDDALGRYGRSSWTSQESAKNESRPSSSADDDSEHGPQLDSLRGLVHASVDTALDIAESLLKMAGGLLDTLTSTARQSSMRYTSASSGSESRHAEPDLLLLEMNPGAPGSSVTGRMEVVNSTRDYLDAISPKCDILVGTGGKSIPGHCVTFVPRIADVAPHSPQQFIVTIEIPGSAKRGTYNGLITVVGHPAVRLLVHLDVD